MIHCAGRHFSAGKRRFGCRAILRGRTPRPGRGPHFSARTAWFSQNLAQALHHGTGGALSRALADPVYEVEGQLTGVAKETRPRLTLIQQTPTRTATMSLPLHTSSTGPNSVSGGSVAMYLPRNGGASYALQTMLDRAGHER